MISSSDKTTPPDINIRHKKILRDFKIIFLDLSDAILPQIQGRKVDAL